VESLDILRTLLNESLDDPERVQLAFTALLGVAAFFLVLGAFFLVSAVSDPVKRRVQHASGNKAGATTGERLTTVLGPVGETFLPKADAEVSRITGLLIQAGIRSNGAIRVFYAVKMLAIIVLPLATLVILYTTTPLPLAVKLLLTVAAAILGYLLPSWWLYRAVRLRQQRLRRALPDALDLMVVCAEAGLGLAATIQRVADDLRLAHPEMAKELEIYTMQTGAGVDSRTALRDLEHRNGLEDLRGLVSTLIQSMRFGTSISDTLRIFAEEMREKRMQRAEEQAAKVSVKMLFPLTFCILPSFMLLALGPPVLGALEALSGVR
jgi:tight adherence protein C